MAKLLYPSSFECDCGHQSHFFENMIRGMKVASRRKRRPTRLLDSEKLEHEIEFVDGRPVAMICPKLGRRKITATVTEYEVRLVNPSR